MDGWSCTENLNCTSENGEDSEIKLSNSSIKSRFDPDVIISAYIDKIINNQ